ncbi:MAG: NAD(P)-dependent oxidoreductase [Verrucomicrobia bacterium]|nr:NAD(P)-dependent oxidoreductase [Verrucomicrobiota bacterium]
MKPTVLVTGGSGFIGTWVIAELLRRECRVVVYDLTDGGKKWRHLVGSSANEVTFVGGDILDAKVLGASFDDHPITNVIHLVGLLTPACQQDPYRGFEINVLGTTRIFELIRERKSQIQGVAYASSIAVYGSAGNDPTSVESVSDGGNAALEPLTFYGAFKRANELIARQYWLHFGIPSVGLRPPLVYGWGRETGLTAGPTLAARAVATGEPFAVSFCGPANFGYVEDSACAFVRAALEIKQGAHTVDVPGEVSTVEEIVSLLKRIEPSAASRLSIAGPPLPYPATPSHHGIEKLFPDWRTTSLEYGFRRTIDLYRKNQAG